MQACKCSFVDVCARVFFLVCMWVVDAWPVQFKDAERREGESLQ